MSVCFDIFWANCDEKIFLDSICAFGEQDEFPVIFLNSYVNPIDIVWINHDGNEVTLKSNLAPGAKHAFETYFTHQWLFKLSSAKESLIATSNGVTGEIFEGCRFKMKPNQQNVVTISKGNLSLSLMSLFLSILISKTD